MRPISEQHEQAEEEGAPEREPVDKAPNDLGREPTAGERTMYTVDDEELA